MEKPLRNNNALQEFLNIIEKVSGLRVCLYDLNDFVNKDKKLSVDRDAFNHTREYCIMVKEANQQKCLNSCRATPLKTFKTPVWRTCHSGLSELIIPIWVKNKYIGALVAGQVFLKALSKNDIEERVKYLAGIGIKEEKAREIISKTPVATDAELKLGLDILNMLVNYIVEVEERFDWQEELGKIKESYAGRKFDSKKEGLKYIAKNVVKMRSLRYENIINNIIEKIKVIPVEKLTLKNVSKEAGFSPYHFSRIFKSVAGKNFRDFAAGTRIERAKKLMENVDLNLSEIAYKSGYEDLSSFCRNFKKVTGINPGKFRLGIINMARR